MSLELRTGAATDVGRVRDVNEDSYVILPEVDLVVVADGMGGHRGGEVASAAALDALGAVLRDGGALTEAIRAANQAVYDRSREEYALRGMGTTLTAVKLDGNRIVIGHVGDSRVYVFRAGALRQLTNDHSLVAELVRSGELTAEQAEHDPRRAMITRAVGIDYVVEPEVMEVEIEAGDRLVVCTDGLTTMLSDAAIGEVVAEMADPQRTAARLVDGANDAGGLDNVTVVVIDVVAGAEPAGGGPDGDGAGGSEPTVEAAAVDGAGTEDDDDTGELPQPAPDAEAMSDRRRRWWRRGR